jgi:DNA-binding transcriptional LysR family regulator
VKRIASLRQLQTFNTVAKLGSVTLAADELHLSQSAVSLQIGELEETFRTKLVARTGRGVRLTDAGEMLSRYADRILVLWTEAGDELSTFVGEFSGTLKIGAVTTAEFFLPRLLVAFASTNPKVKVKLHVDKRDAIVRSLATQEIDIAIMGQPPQELNVAAAPFAKNPVAFVAAPDHPLMSHPHLTLGVLAESRLLVREPGSGTRATVERIFDDAGLRLRIGSELSGNEAIKQMCAAGFGPAYLSLHTCILEIKAGLLGIMPMPNNPFLREWFVVRLFAHTVPPVALEFERFLCQRGRSEVAKQLPPEWQKAVLTRGAEFEPITPQPLKPTIISPPANAAAAASAPAPGLC